MKKLYAASMKEVKKNLDKTINAGFDSLKYGHITFGEFVGSSSNDDKITITDPYGVAWTVRYFLPKQFRSVITTSNNYIMMCWDFSGMQKKAERILPDESFLDIFKDRPTGSNVPAGDIYQYLNPLFQENLRKEVQEVADSIDIRVAPVRGMPKEFVGTHYLPMFGLDIANEPKIISLHLLGKGTGSNLFKRESFEPNKNYPTGVSPYLWQNYINRVKVYFGMYSIPFVRVLETDKKGYIKMPMRKD